VLPRSARGARLGAAARAGAAGLSGVAAQFAAPLLGAPGAHGRDETDSAPTSRSPDGASLTPREHEVLSLLAEGLSNPEIAEALEISAHTAKFHVNAILEKLDARTRTEAVVRAARLGLLVL
jgi:DNA-binding NarL/FixJ family response regulator